jgi:hypothetical protein
LSLPTTWVMGCAYAPSGQAVACGGLDNKLTVFPLSLEDDSSTRKKVVGTHTSYTSCCLFPGSDNQVGTVLTSKRRVAFLRGVHFLAVFRIFNNFRSNYRKRKRKLSKIALRDF